MKQIKQSSNAHQWPRQTVQSIECRKRDLIIRIADWHRVNPRNGTAGYDVEVYIGGVFDWNESKNCDTKTQAVAFAQAQIARLL